MNVIELLKCSIQVKISENDIEKLAEALKDTDCASRSSFLKCICSAINANILKLDFNSLSNSSDFIKIILDRLANIHRNEFNLLICIAFINNEQIHEQILKNLLDNHSDKLTDYIEMLANLSFLNKIEDISGECLVSIDSELQEEIVKYIKLNIHKDFLSEILTKCALVINSQLEFVHKEDVTCIKESKKAYKHAVKLLNYIEMLPDDILCKILTNLTEYHKLWKEDLIETIKIETKILKLKEKFGDKLKKDIAKSLYNIGLFQFYLGNYQISKENFDKSLEIDKESICLITIASCNKVLGNGDKAKEYFKKRIELCKNILGFYKEDISEDLHQIEIDAPNYCVKKMTEIANCLLNLGRCFEELGEAKLAIKCLETILRVFECPLCQSDNDFASIMFTLSLCYLKLGELNKAISHARVCLALRKKIYGELCYDTLMAMSLVGSIYMCACEFAESKRYLSRWIEMAPEVNLEYPMMSIIVALGVCCMKLGQNEGAELNFEKYLKLTRRNAFNDFEGVAFINSMNVISHFYLRRKNYEKASESNEELAEFIEYKFEGDFENKELYLYKAFKDAAFSYKRLGVYEKAGQFFGKLLELQKKLNVNADEVKSTLLSMALAYQKLKQFDKAIEYYDAILEDGLMYGSRKSLAFRQRRKCFKLRARNCDLNLTVLFGDSLCSFK